METYDKVTYDILKENKDNYICLGGFGILDGLKFPCKSSLLKIGEVKKVDGVYLKYYRCRKWSILPEMSFNQICRIYTAKEYKKLPTYI